MKKILVIICALFQCISLNASILKSVDTDKECTLYRVPNETSPALSDEIIISDKDAYGFSFSDMDIDFKNKIVTIVPVINIVLGLNRPLIAKRAFISNKNSDFKFLINQLNRKLLVFEKICINESNEIIYAKQFEATPTELNK
jgi:hypothetical protein